MVLLFGKWLIKALQTFVDHLSFVHIAKNREKGASLLYCQNNLNPNLCIVSTHQ